MMPISHDILAETYRALTAACFAGLWQGAVFAVLASVLIRLTPRASASLRHTLLVAVFALTTLLPWVHFGSRTAVAGGHGFSIAPWIAVAVAALWMALAAIRAAGLLVAWNRLRMVRRNAVPVVLDGTAAFQAGERRAELCISADVDSPTIIGFWSPRLLLPEWMVPLLTEDDLQQIALHECEHLRRGDDWLNLLLQVGLVVSPLNPALVWLNRRIAMQRELACDAAVVSRTAQPIAYATCLTRLAEQRMHHTRLALALAAWGKQSELGLRVHALLTHTAQWSGRQSRAAACAAAAVLVAGSVAVVRTPLMVRVAQAPQTMAASASSALGAGDRVFTDRMPTGMRMMPAAFAEKPVSAALPLRTKRRNPSESTLSVRPLPVAVPHVQGAARMLRTSADAAARPHLRTAEEMRTAQQDSRDDVRFITTEFSAPYVAVPVANGWLVFQL